MKLIAVSQRVDYLRDRNEIRESIDQNLSSFLLANELCPVLISNKLISNNSLGEMLSTFDISGIVLSGGNNIGEVKELLNI